MNELLTESYIYGAMVTAGYSLGTCEKVKSDNVNILVAIACGIIWPLLIAFNFFKEKK